MIWVHHHRDNANNSEKQDPFDYLQNVSEMFSILELLGRDPPPFYHPKNVTCH